MRISQYLKVAFLREAILTKRLNKKTNQKEWALVSKKNPKKILEWYGVEKPSKEDVQESERRVQFFKQREAS